MQYLLRQPSHNEAQCLSSMKRETMRWALPLVTPVTNTLPKTCHRRAWALEEAEDPRWAPISSLSPKGQSRIMNSHTSRWTSSKLMDLPSLTSLSSIVLETRITSSPTLLRTRCGLVTNLTRTPTTQGVSSTWVQLVYMMPRSSSLEDASSQQEMRPTLATRSMESSRVAINEERTWHTVDTLIALSASTGMSMW